MEAAGSFLENLNLTVIYVAFVGLGIIFCAFSCFMGGDVGSDACGLDGANLGGDGSDGPGCLLSPTGMAFFLTSFGAYGLIFFLGFKTTALMSVVLSTFLAAITMFALNYMFFKLFTKSGTVVEDENLEGLQGEIYTAISAGGVGEILYRDSRGRQKSLARSEDGEPIAAGTRVIIKSELSSTLVVARVDKDELKDK